MSGKVIIVTIDDRTCQDCLLMAGLDPDIHGYPPFHEPDPVTGDICRCVVKEKQ